MHGETVRKDLWIWLEASTNAVGVPFCGTRRIQMRFQCKREFLCATIVVVTPKSVIALATALAIPPVLRLLDLIEGRILKNTHHSSRWELF